MQRLLWTTGLSGASLDSIARSASLNRPSLAAAFGDKDAIYAKAAEQYAAMMDARLSEAIRIVDLSASLNAMFAAAIDVYTTDGPDGCFVICTAPAEALTNPVCRTILQQSLEAIDAFFLRRLELERRRSIGNQADLPLLAAQLGAIEQLLLRQTGAPNVQLGDSLLQFLDRPDARQRESLDMATAPEDQVAVRNGLHRHLKFEASEESPHEFEVFFICVVQE